MKLIEELKAAEQNASGMFEISEDAICELVNILSAIADFRKATAGQEFPCLKLEKSSLPVSKFDNEYIRNRLQAFNDTDEIVGWLSELADEYQEAEYDLREAATSLCEMYADLKDFGNELIRLQERHKAVPVAPDEMTVETAYPEVQTNWSDAKYYTSGWNACRAVMLATAPKPENAND